jgi:hypothetical protein
MAEQISVGSPIGLAMNRTGEMLFRPFRASKWFILALPAGLTLLFEEGGGFNGNGFNGGGGGGRGGGGGAPPSPAEMMHEAGQWMQNHFTLIVIGAIALFVIFVALWIVCRWLNCRGRFMFFDNVVHNDTRIKAPWSDYREIANSLWGVRLVWDVIRWILSLGSMVLVFLILLPDLRQFYESGNYRFTAATGTALAVGLPLFFLMGVCFWVLNAILFHLAVPTMYIRRMRALPAIGVAWRELFLRHVGTSLVYFLFLMAVQIVWAIWFLIAFVVTCCATLCIGGILAALPLAGTYVHALITLPVLTFKSAYRLHFVSQFGDEYRIDWQMNTQGGFPVIPDEPQNPYALQ